jgi:hypothetical protein
MAIRAMRVTCVYARLGNMTFTQGTHGTRYNCPRLALETYSSLNAAVAAAAEAWWMPPAGRGGDGADVIHRPRDHEPYVGWRTCVRVIDNQRFSRDRGILRKHLHYRFQHCLVVFDFGGHIPAHGTV